MTVSLVDGLIWYSTGDKNTYGTYRIREAARKSSIIKVIASAENKFRVFFLQDISRTGFMVCFATNLLNTKDEANRMELEECANTMDRMEVYYPSDAERRTAISNSSGVTQRFYYPLAFLSNFATGEAQRVQNFLRVPTTSYEKANADFKFNLFWDQYKLTQRAITPSSREASDARLNSLKSISGSLPVERLLTRALNPNGTPFDRDYVTINLVPVEVNSADDTLSVTPDTIPDPCATTYRSIAEAIRAVNACRLNIANGNLESLPSTLTNLRTLRYLDVRNNYLSSRDSILLQEYLPNCVILFSPQRTRSMDWVFLERIELTPKNIPEGRHAPFFKELSAALSRNPTAQLKIVAYYTSVYDRKEAESIASQVRTYLQKSIGLAAGRLITETVLAGSQPRSTQRSLKQQPSTEQSLIQQVKLSQPGKLNLIAGEPVYVDIFSLNLPAFR